MSNPGDTPNPYASQPPPGTPYHQIPTQSHNPYAQPHGGYGYPGQAAAMPGAPGAPGTAGATGATGAVGKKTPGWLWAVGGAVVASAVWAGVLFAGGGFGEPEADLRGYAYQDDLCAKTSFTPFEDNRYALEDSSTASSAGENPEHSGGRHAALDSMSCNADLTPTEAGPDDYSSTFVATKAVLHKKTDPAPEFEAQYRSYELQKSSGYTVEPVQGIGDEAFLVTRGAAADSKGSHVILGVRDGWFTYEIAWSSYSSGGSSVRQPRPEAISDMLQDSTRQTLPKLRG